MRQRRTLYRRVAGVRPNNLRQSDPESAQWLWRNLPSSSGTCRKTTLRRVGGFMSFNATKTYLIPARSWRQAQQPPAIRSRIGQLVVEESAIEFWDRQHTIQSCNIMRKHRGGSILYRCKACAMANNLPQKASESVVLSWSNPPSSKISPT